MSKKITIIGTGAYGTALANVLADNGHEVVMYGVVEKQVNDLNIYHYNTTFFQELRLNERIRATTDLSAALEYSEILILCVPSYVLRSVISEIITVGKNSMLIINTAKGLDEIENKLLSEVVKKEFSKSNIMKGYAALFGPSIAIEVAERKPTGVMVVSEDLNIATQLCEIFKNEYFYAYPGTDLVGSELGAALKNIVAIGSGILKGFEAGDNAQASLITVGLNEIAKIGAVLGANSATWLDFAGLGDLVLTASSIKSRNYRFGMLIAKHKNTQKALEELSLTVEGYRTTQILYSLAKEYSIENNFFKIMYEILFNNKNPISLINNVFNGFKF